MKKMLSPIIYLLILLLTPLTVFAIPTANVTLLGSGPRDYNFEFENTTSDLGYDIYYIEFEIPSDPIVSNFDPPNINWDATNLNISTRSFTFDTSDNPLNMIQSGCAPTNCVGNVSFDTDKDVSEFRYTLYFTNILCPDPLAPSCLGPDLYEQTGSISRSVPEPSSMYLLCSGVGAIGLLIYLRRLNRKYVNF